MKTGSQSLASTAKTDVGDITEFPLGFSHLNLPVLAVAL